jgi:hypothetical protein
MRAFVEGMLRAGDPKVLNRLALDQGLIEKFLKSITYDIRVFRGGNIEFGTPTLPSEPRAPAWPPSCSPQS